MTPQRRTVLANSIGVFSMLAGCSTIPGGFSRTSQLSYPPLYGVEILNKHESEQTVDLFVQVNRNIVHWAEHTALSANSGQERDSEDGTITIIESTAWPGCGGDYLINARLDNSQEWAQLDFANLNVSRDEMNDPHLVRVQISQNEDLSIVPLPVDNTFDCETTT